MLKKVIKKVFKKNQTLKEKYQKISFSQSGEDLIVKFLFDAIQIAQPSYLDIGAHHPYYLNNTALFYLSGSTGINIEPDPSLFKPFISERKRDINLNIGISDKESEQDFYLFNVPTLNTFSKEEAAKFEKEGNYFVKETKKIKVQTIENILAQYSNNKFPNFLTIDAEGVDELILKSIDFKTNFPIVICVETLSFSSSGNGKKNYDLIHFLESNQYLLYADTNNNSIFIKKEFWLNH